MKRVYLILTLFMTSFFLLSSNVKADTITYEVPEELIQILESEDFKILREKIINHCNVNNKNYYIYYSSSSNSFTAYVINKFNMSLSKRNDSTPFWYYSSSTREAYKLVDGELYKSTSYNNITINFFNNGVFSYNDYIDSNIEVFKVNADVNLLITYKELSYEIAKGSNLPSVYQIYSDYKNTVEEPEEIDPKAEIVTNFYFLVIDKIKLLTNYIVTDYIILSALVIFIFVAVIGLVRRLK